MDSIFSKLSNILSNEKDTYWAVDQQTKELVEMEKCSRNQWDDSASKHLWIRYIYPFEEDSVNMLNQYDLAIKDSESLIINDNHVCENSTDVDKLSVDISIIENKTRQEIDLSHKAHERAKEYHGRCVDLAYNIDAIIEEEKSLNFEFSTLYQERASVY